MVPNRDEDVKNFIDLSKKFNSKIFTVTRWILLTLISLFQDGIQYRDLKTTLRPISDGNLYSNLIFLESMKYLIKSKEKLDNREYDIYSITQQGRRELGKALKWIKLTDKIIGEKIE